jgi:mono/diheme cytochrome c family protein
LAATGLYAWSIVSQGFSARREPGSVEAFVAKRLRYLATPGGARDLQNPFPAGPESLKAAMAHYADHCATCHGNDGRGMTDIGQGMYPRPPDMTAAGTQQLTDGELYYIIENGVRFTGMPAFGEGPGGDQNKESWDLVHFIRHLPSITDEELAEMKKMNPKSPMELAKEEEMRRFLAGDDSEPPGLKPSTNIKEREMFNRLAICVVLTILVTGMVYGHGDPIMGTVTAVTGDSFTIKDRNDKPVVIMLEKATKYMKADKPVQKSDLKVGLRVIIDAHMDTKMKMYAAEEVVIGTAAAPAKK